MGWFEDDGATLMYGESDYKKARKVLDNPATYKLLRDRIDPKRCYLGKPVVWWFDCDWEHDLTMFNAYLDTYDVVQEVNIDAILDFMPKEHLSYEGFDGEEVCKRDLVRDDIVEWLSNEKGILGYFQDKIDMYMNAGTSIAEAKAFSKLCRTETGERQNNAIIAEHILTEALDPPSDSEYQDALASITKALDTGILWKGNKLLNDYREQKGLIQAPVEAEEADEADLEADEVETQVYTNPNSGQASWDAFCEQSSDSEAEPVSEPVEKVGGFGITNWVDSKFKPMEDNNPGLYKVFFVLLSPIMFPIAIIEGIVEGIVEGFTGSSKKKQWYQQDDDGNWIPVVIDEVTGEVTHGEGIS